MAINVSEIIGLLAKQQKIPTLFYRPEHLSPVLDTLDDLIPAEEYFDRLGLNCELQRDEYKQTCFDVPRGLVKTVVMDIDAKENDIREKYAILMDDVSIGHRIMYSYFDLIAAIVDTQRFNDGTTKLLTMRKIWDEKMDIRMHDEIYCSTCKDAQYSTAKNRAVTFNTYKNRVKILRDFLQEMKEGKFETEELKTPRQYVWMFDRYVDRSFFGSR